MGAVSFWQLELRRSVEFIIQALQLLKQTASEANSF
jgi:hypothetical protein